MKNNKFKIVKSLIFICILYVTVTSFYNVISQISDHNKQISSLNKQIEYETKINKQLKDKKQNLDTDEHYKEVARDTLGFVNPGDKVYINSNDANSK